METIKQRMRFTRRLDISAGNALKIVGLVFADDESLHEWLGGREFLAINERYGAGNITLEISELQGLVVGEICRVMGEGMDEFEIIKLVKYAPNNYGFVLDSGIIEPVYKCYLPDDD